MRSVLGYRGFVDALIGEGVMIVGYLCTMLEVDLFNGSGPHPTRPASLKVWTAFFALDPTRLSSESRYPHVVTARIRQML